MHLGDRNSKQALQDPPLLRIVAIPETLPWASLTPPSKDSHPGKPKASGSLLSAFEGRKRRVIDYSFSEMREQT